MIPETAKETPECHQIKRCGCSPELTDASLMASRLREKLASANDNNPATGSK
jgi:hypothetical protein